MLLFSLLCLTFSYNHSFMLNSTPKMLLDYAGVMKMEGLINKLGSVTLEVSKKFMPF